MPLSIALATLLVITSACPETRLAQVAPHYPIGQICRTPGQTRAVILIHGLQIHPVSSSSVGRPLFPPWQGPESTLVKRLGTESDVFAFAYGQDASVDEIAGPGLGPVVASIRQAGYSEIVLIGYSAGGLIARQFVEDDPTAGVTKVIQVCAPNGGSAWGKLTFGVRAPQAPFLLSLTREGRQSAQRQRGPKEIPPQIEFVCVVGLIAGSSRGDGLVQASCQWTEDLQTQGVPAVILSAWHVTVMRSAATAEKLAVLVRERQPRWNPFQVEATRHRLFKGQKQDPKARPEMHLFDEPAR